MTAKLPKNTPDTAFSLVVTTLNNASTLDQCLASVRGADEIIVLDSGSTDATQEIALQYGARWEQQDFMGYGQQKQAAVNLASNDWVLLLDADEALSPALAVAIETLMARGPEYKAYRLRRCEQLFWRWQSAGTKLITAIRLFDRRDSRLSHEAVHAGVITNQSVMTLKPPLWHRAETDVHAKVARINAYSSGMVEGRLAARARFLRTRMLLYPMFAFWREYLFRRQCLNGWAGFIAAKNSAFYAFLKYAKLFDAQQQRSQDLLDTRSQHYRSP